MFIAYRQHLKKCPFSFLVVSKRIGLLYYFSNTSLTILNYYLINSRNQKLHIKLYRSFEFNLEFLINEVISVIALVAKTIGQTQK